MQLAPPAVKYPPINTINIFSKVLPFTVFNSIKSWLSIAHIAVICNSTTTLGFVKEKSVFPSALVSDIVAPTVTSL